MKWLGGSSARFSFRPLVLVFSALWALALVPIWSSRFLPLMDLPSHLAAVAIWHRHLDPEWGYARFYELNLLPLPYFGHYFPVHLLSFLVPIEVANKIYISLYAAMLPAGFALLARRLGRSPWLALFAFPFVFNAVFSLGFVTCCAAMALLPFALIALDSFLARPGFVNGALTALLAVALYLEHLFPWAFFGVAAISFLLVAGVRRARTWAGAALLVPSLILACVGYSLARGASTALKSGPVQLTAEYQPLSILFGTLPRRLLMTWGGQEVTWLLLALGLVWLALMVTHRWESSDLSGWRPEILFCLAAAAYLFLPLRINRPIDVWYVGARFAPLAVLFACLLPRGELTGWRRFILLPAILVAVYYPIQLTRHWRQFNRNAIGMAEVMQQVPRGSSTLTLIGHYQDPNLDPEDWPYLHFSSYAALLAGGFDPYGLNSGFPMRIRAALAIPDGSDQFDFARDSPGYDFIVTNGERRPYERIGASNMNRAPVQSFSGDWILYRVLR